MCQLPDGVRDSDWVDAIDMPSAQVAVAAFVAGAAARLCIRRARLGPGAGTSSRDPLTRGDTRASWLPESRKPGVKDQRESRDQLICYSRNRA